MVWASFGQQRNAGFLFGGNHYKKKGKATGIHTRRRSRTVREQFMNSCINLAFFETLIRKNVNRLRAHIYQGVPSVSLTL